MAHVFDARTPIDIGHTFEDKQYGGCQISTTDGGFAVHISFSNGKKYDGDHFGCDVIFWDGTKNPVFGVQFRAGINGAWWGKTKERHFDRLVPMKDDTKGRVETISITFYQVDQSPDKEIWETVKKVVETIVEAWQDQEKEPNHGADRISRGGRGFYINVADLVVSD